MKMMNGIFMSMLGLMMMPTCSMASHPLDPRPIPKYDEGSGEPIRPADYEENTGN
jgi:energy-converting hydrogenase Eha subunit F